MLKKLKRNANNWITDNKKKISFMGHTGKRLTMCKSCYTFYYKRSWHFERPAYLENDHEEDIPVRFTKCPACMEQEIALYERENNFVFR